MEVGSGASLWQVRMVVDELARKEIRFDPTGLEAWGPIRIDRDVEALYRHPTGHWTLLIDPRPEYGYLPEKLVRLSDAAAAKWLVQAGCREIPAELQEYAAEWIFDPTLMVEEVVENERSIEHRLAELGFLEECDSEPAGNHAEASSNERGAEGFEANEVKVLKAHAEHPDELRIQIDLEASAGLARKTVGRVVRRLMDKEMIERPNGPRKGTKLTDKGREWVKKLN